MDKAGQQEGKGGHKAVGILAEVREEYFQQLLRGSSAYEMGRKCGKLGLADRQASGRAADLRIAAGSSFLQKIPAIIKKETREGYQ